MVRSVSLKLARGPADGRGAGGGYSCRRLLVQVSASVRLCAKFSVGETLVCVFHFRRVVFVQFLNESEGLQNYRAHEGPANDFVRSKQNPSGLLLLAICISNT